MPPDSADRADSGQDIAMQENTTSYEEDVEELEQLDRDLLWIVSVLN
jgi:vacuolar-type H+-ATPase subunit C/Vma6